MINNASILHARPTMFPNFVSVYSFYLIILRKTKNMGLRWHWLWVLPQILKDPLSASKERNYITPIWFSVNTRMDLFTIILFPKLSIVQKGIQSYSVFYMIFVVMQLLMYGIQTTDAAHVSINVLSASYPFVNKTAPILILYPFYISFYLNVKWLQACSCVSIFDMIWLLQKSIL